jgi:hypothetical protein
LVISFFDLSKTVEADLVLQFCTLNKRLNHPLLAHTPPILLRNEGLNEDFLNFVGEHCKMLVWFASGVHIDRNSDLLSLITLGKCGAYCELATH